MNNFQLADGEAAVFTAVARAPQPPGSIVRDFDTLLDALGGDGIAVSPKNAEFTLSRLPELNARLTQPAAIGLSRSRQISYPHLDGLHMLLLGSRLARLDRSRPAPRMVQDTAMVARWQILNPTERYFILLERWWSLGDSETGLLWYPTSLMAKYRSAFLQHYRPGTKAKDLEHGWQTALTQLLKIKQIALMQLFGLLDITEARIIPGKGWQIKHLAATRWGLSACDSFLRAFQHTAGGMLDPEDDSTEDEDASGDEDPAEALTPSDEERSRSAFIVWATGVNPFFPDWQQGLGEPEAAPFPGSVTLKVSLGKDLWRRISMPGKSSFADLAFFILHAFGFDYDHLYTFTYLDEYGSRRTLDDPRGYDADDGYAQEVTLGEAGLCPRQVIEFHYDFGDDWRFEVLVEALDAADTHTKARVLDKAGKAPRQYR